MEDGAPLNRFQGQRSSHGVHATDPRRSQPSSSATAGGSNGDTAPACTIREQDRFMPIANVIRIMRKVLPTHAKISDDAKETIQECTSEFISFITSEANERCQHEQRKTITAEDVLWAMSKLGFDDYVQPLTLYLHRYRELEGDHRGSLRGDPLALPIRRTPPQLPSDPTMFVPPLPQPSFHLPPPPAQQGPSMAQQLGMYNEGMGMGGYYTYGGDGSRRGGGMNGAGPSNEPMGGFDPYGQYK